MKKKNVTILTGEPTIEVIAEMGLDWAGVRGMAKWVKSHRPECLPDEYDPSDEGVLGTEHRLFPHGCFRDAEGGAPPPSLTDNELLVELAGRKCYDSFGLKAGKKTNAEYIAHTQSGDVKHASIMYHAKMTFFIAGVSRRVSQEMMRNYVGSDRSQEGSPSQESSRFTHHYGTFVAHPRLLEPGMEDELKRWTEDVQEGYDRYIRYIERQFALYEKTRGEPCKGMARKRIYESSIGRMPWDFETSYIWTTNPVALAKFFRERCDDASDLEMQRFAKKWRAICLARWPNLFPGLT